MQTIREHESLGSQTQWRNMPVRFPAKSFLWKFFCVIARISTLIFPQFETFCNSDDEFEKIVLGPLKL